MVSERSNLASRKRKAKNSGSCPGLRQPSAEQLSRLFRMRLASLETCVHCGVDSKTAQQDHNGEQNGPLQQSGRRR